MQHSERNNNMAPQQFRALSNYNRKYVPCVQRSKNIVEVIRTHGVNRQPPPIKSYKYSAEPISVECPICKYSGLTKVSHHIKRDTGIIMCVLCLLLFPIGLVPLLIDCCQTTDHYCEKCGEKLGTSRPGCCCCC